MLGRHRKALAELGRLFKAGRVDKCYWAVVEGGPAEHEGRVDLPLGRKDASRGWWMQHDPLGQPATTTWKVLGRARFTFPCRGEVGSADLSAEPGGGSLRVGGLSGFSGGESAGPTPDRLRRSDPPPAGEGEKEFTWLALEPLTGRTHQLRVHCAALGWPIVGDSVYGNAPRAGGPPLHLHAREIVVPLYKNRDPIRVMAPVPLHMHETLQACGWQGEVFTLVG